MRSIQEVDSLKGKTVFVRADFNVPVSGGVVSDDFRIKKTIPLIRLLRERGARIILASHFEGEGGSLRPVFNYLKELFPVSFIEDFYPEVPPALQDALEKGDVVLFENLRKYPQEKANDESFARHLASCAQIYVNEAFSAAHREHASVVGVPKFLTHYAGIVFEEEVRELSKAFEPSRPFIFILGGAKFETKIPLVEKFFNLADKVFIGGALSNDFFRAKGFATGKSLLSPSNTNVNAFLTQKLILPVDVLVKNEEGVTVKKPEEVSKDDYIVDVGPQSMEDLCAEIRRSSFVLWNGPLGNFEIGFKDATLRVAECVAESNAVSIVGGGDTIASIAELNLFDKFSFISTGGGAMLDFLAHETLPGIEALE